MIISCSFLRIRMYFLASTLKAILGYYLSIKMLETSSLFATYSLKLHVQETSFLQNNFYLKQEYCHFICFFRLTAKVTKRLEVIQRMSKFAGLSFLLFISLY